MTHSRKKWSLILALLITMPRLSFAAEKDLYDFLWLDPDKTVYVLQNKTYKKAKTFYGNLGYISGLSSEFQDTTGIHLSMGYYFNEEWAFEVLYNKYSNKNNSSYKNIQSINGSVPFLRRQNSLIGAMAIWSPFYGKINTFNKIIYFDWSFGLGGGKIDAESNALTAADESVDAFASESYTGFIGKTSFRVHVTKNIHLQIEYLKTMYQAPGPKLPDRTQTDKWRSNSDLIFAVGFSF